MAHRYTDIEIDTSLYDPEPHEVQFLREQTGIQDELALQKLIFDVQKEAYDVFPYMCIRRFRFLCCSISKHKSWSDALRVSRERKRAIFLDAGCCFGNDIRMAISRGWPRENVVGTDLHSGFWELGHKLFQDTPKSFPVPFVGGSIFDNDVLDPTARQVRRPPLTQSSLTSLTPLIGHVSVIHMRAFFHLFLECEQEELVKRVKVLISKQRGSLIFGSHTGEPDGREGPSKNPRGKMRYIHSPRTFKKLWESVFGADKIETNIQYEEVEWRWGHEEAKAMGIPEEEEGRHGWLVWMIRIL